MSVLYGVGVGPGDPELLTLKALRCIGESDIIILPSEPKEECYAYKIVQEVYPEIDNKEIICMPFPMIMDKAELKQVHDRIYENINLLLKQNKSVAFLVIGDPTVYSTYSYIHNRVIMNQGNAVMINGIPSFCAAAAVLGVSLADNREEIHIIPGCYDISQTLELSGTKIYMKAGSKLAELKKALLEYEGSKVLEVSAVSNCGMENEKISVGLEELNQESGYLTVIVVKEKRTKSES
ncbi:MAG: precorrin-2 C(20)-methyltransferase [Mobilitalea sp.]